MAKKGAANKESKKNEGKKKNKLIEGMFERTKYYGWHMASHRIASHRIAWSQHANTVHGMILALAIPCRIIS